MEAVKYTQKVIQERGGAIRFIRAVEDGTMCWFYLKLSAEKLAEYEAGIKRGSLDIRDYGTILESDWGSYPPQDVIRFMKEEHGFDTPEKE